MELILKNPKTNKTLTIDNVKDDDTISNLKDRILSKEGLEVNESTKQEYFKNTKFVFCGKTLTEDSRTLKEWGITRQNNNGLRWIKLELQKDSKSEIVTNNLSSNNLSPNNSYRTYKEVSFFAGSTALGAIGGIGTAVIAVVLFHQFIMPALVIGLLAGVVIGATAGVGSILAAKAIWPEENNISVGPDFKG